MGLWPAPLMNTLCLLRGVKCLSVHWPAKPWAGWWSANQGGKGAYRAWTHCVSTIRNDLLTSIWNPGPDLSLCVERETIQNTFRVVSWFERQVSVIGSGFPKSVTEMWQVVVCSYRPLSSWKAGQSSCMELPPLSPSAQGDWKQMALTPVTQA